MRRRHSLALRSCAVAEESDKVVPSGAADVESLAIVGAGNVGFSLGRAFAAAGFRIEWVASRSAAAARELAETLGSRVIAGADRDRPQVDVVYVCVPDDAIESVAADLAARGDWSGCVAAHVSGALASSVLEPLSQKGAAVLSFHPMMTIHRETPAAAFGGVRVNLEGTAEGIAAGRTLGRAIGADPHVIDAKTKTAIHIAATFVSNYLVTLVTLASEILSRAGVGRAEFEPLLRPLAEATLGNVNFGRPGDALTGPISRGDAQTLERHLRRIKADYRDLLPVMLALTSETVRVAAETGHISTEKAEKQLLLLRTMVQNSIDDGETGI